MCNIEILEKLTQMFGKEREAEICNIISVLYDIKMTNCKNNTICEEFDFERRWWYDKYNEILKEEL